MNLALHLAKDSLRHHRLRVRLSMIGIIISVFIISLVIIISDSVKLSFYHQLERIDKRSIIISGARDSGLINLPFSTPRDTLRNTDIKQISKIIPKSSAIHSTLITSGGIQFGKTKVTSQIIATSVTNPANLELHMLNGSWFEDEKDKNLVILGEGLANQLLGTNQARSQVITIKGQRFTVIGIIRRTNQALSIRGYNTDHSAYISLDNGQRLIRSDNVSQIIVTKISKIDQTKTKLSQILTHQHADSSDYSITSGEDISAKMNDLVRILVMSSLGITSLILLISSISLANIMLVGVIERQREIGIRKAVGANTKDIVSQFLAEALIISLRGGLVGLLLAYIVASIYLLTHSMMISFSPLAIILGLVVPTMTGLIAGVYPAYKASKQDIISALNQLT